MDELQQSINLLWIIIAAGMVLFLQAGFTAIVSGKTRAKNTNNVAQLNLVDYIV